MGKTINDLNSIEAKLDSFLRPVNPEEGFVVKLKDRLLVEPEITIEKPDYLIVLTLVGSMFFVGVLVVWILYRLINRKPDSK
jgi:hypothetical protein